MKKFLSLILCAVLLFSFAACSKGDGKPDDDLPTLFPEETTTKAKKAGLDDTVKIRLPITMLEPQYQKDLDAYCEKFGYDKAKLSRDGETVEITMNAFSHDLLLTQIGLKVMNSIAKVTDSGEYPSIKELKEIDRDNFSRVVVTVDKSTYRKDGSRTGIFIIGQSCLLYQAYTVNNDYRCEVVAVDEKTNEIVETKVYTNTDK